MSRDGANPRDLGREEIAILLPVRLAGSRFPGKALEDLRGEPLFMWPYKAAARSGLADTVAVVTDSGQVWAEADLREVTTISRPEWAATGSDRLANVLSEPSFHKIKLIINLQADEPEVSPNDLRLLVDHMKNNRTCQVATLSCDLPEEDRTNPNVVKVLTDRYDNAVYFTRASVPKSQLCRAHVGVYAYRRRVLEAFGRYPRGRLEQAENLEQLRLLEEGVPVAVIPLAGRRRSVNVPSDLESLRNENPV
jgi:3-deoxy-manno-octulosonate cytidylyltransferase (CMP-KDO synthetase)